MTAEQVQIRRDTAANLTAATPAAGELGYDTTNQRIVVGNGTTAGGVKIPSFKDQQNQSFVYIAAGGTGDAITLTYAPAVAAYAAGQRLTFKASASNTTAVTVAVNGLATKDIKKMRNGALAALVANDIISGGIYDLFYDGTQFQIKSTSEGPYTSGALVLLGSQTASASATLNFTSMLSSTYDTYFVVIKKLIHSTNPSDLYLRVSKDNGSSYESGGIYAYNNTKLASGAFSFVNNAGQAQMIIGSSSGGGSGSFYIHNANDTADEQLFIGDLSLSGPSAYHFTGTSGPAGAINAFRLLPSTGNFTSGTVYVYGVAKS